MNVGFPYHASKHDSFVSVVCSKSHLLMMTLDLFVAVYYYCDYILLLVGYELCLW